MAAVAGKLNNPQKINLEIKKNNWNLVGFWGQKSICKSIYKSICKSIFSIWDFLKKSIQINLQKINWKK